MNLKFTTSLLLLVVILTGSAQSLEIAKGPVIDRKEIRKNFDIPVVIATPFNRISVTTALFFNTKEKLTYNGIGFQNRGFQFAVMEDYLNFKEVKKLSAETIGGEQVGLVAFLTLNTKTFVLYITKIPDQDQFSLYVNEVSIGMVLLGSPILVRTFKDLKAGGTALSVSLSDDEKFLLVSRVYSAKSKEKQKVEFLALDDSFGTIWQHVLETEYLERDLEVQYSSIDNNGNMYTMALDYTGKVNKPILYTYFWKNKSLKKATLGIAGGDNFGAGLEILDGVKPMIVGLNNNEKKVSYFIARVNDKTQEVDNLGTTPMPDNFYKTANEAYFSTRSWKVTDMVSLSNNSVVATISATLAIENKYVTYYSFNVYAVSFQENGKSNWIKTIPKKQTTINELAGHMVVAANDKVLIVYNDDSNNLTKKPEDTDVDRFNGRSAVIVVQEIDAAGKITKYPLSTDKELAGYSLNLNNTAKIEKGLYFGTLMKVSGLPPFESRNLTFKVK